MDVCAAIPGSDSLMFRGSVELAQTLLKGDLMLQDNYGLYMDIESICKHMDWLDLYRVTSLEQYNYAPIANLWTLFYAWGQLLYNQTVSELHVYLWSL